MEKNNNLTWDIIATAIILIIGAALMCYGQLSCNYEVSDLGVVLMILSFAPVYFMSIKKSNQNK